MAARPDMTTRRIKHVALWLLALTVTAFFAFPIVWMALLR
jgi:hypothetical protein